MGKEVVLLDFVEHDSVAALEFLIDMFNRNEASGMVFALKLKHKAPSVFCGSTGTLANNIFEGAGIAGLLHLQMVKHANEN